MPVRRPRATWPVSFFALAAGILSLSLPLPVPSQAQSIKLDGSLGSRTTLTGPAYTIPHDLGQTRGANLFHSFEQFNVLTGESATFTGPNTISRVVGRVTGGVQSFIDGLLGTDFAGAKPEFYLINPSGLLFGPNASLNVSGSVHFSTADYLRLADNNRFNAVPGTADALLTMEPVAAFGFLGPSAAPITLERNSVLQVATGRTLSLIGGDISITGGPAGFQSAPGGRINMAGVQSSGEVIPIIPTTPEMKSDMQLVGFKKLGTIQLSDQAFLSVSGRPSGTIVIRGGKLQVTEGSFIGAQMNGGTADGATVGLDIRIAEDIELSNALLSTDNIGTGKAGAIVVSAGKRLDLLNGSEISSATFGRTGTPGNLDISADSVTAVGTSTSGGLFGAMVQIHARSLELTSGAVIRANTNPTQKGDINIDATESIVLSGSAAGLGSGLYPELNSSQTPTAAIGDVVLKTGSLKILDGAQIDVGSSVSTVSGGNLIIMADTLLVSGWTSRILATPHGFGQSGTIRVAGQTTPQADRLEINDGGKILGGSTMDLSANQVVILGRSTKNSAINSSVDGTVIRINAESFEISSGASASVSGTGSLLNIEAQRVLLSTDKTIPAGNGTAALRATASDTSPGGEIKIKSANVEIRDGSAIDVSTQAAGDGGKATIQADQVILSGSNSTLAARIDASSRTNAQGGTVTITADSLQLTDSAKILGVARAGGKGGTIDVTTATLELTGGAAITADALAAGAGGSITVSADHISLSGTGPQPELAASFWRISPNAVVPSMISASTQRMSSGPAGTVAMKGKSGGHLLVEVTDGATIQASTSGTGKGGSIQIQAAELKLNNEGAIHADSLDLAQGNAGSIVVTADLVMLEGLLPRPNDLSRGFLTRISAAPSLGSFGKGGSVRIEANTLEIRDTSEINAASVNVTGNLVNVSDASLDGENLVIRAGRLDVLNAGFIGHRGSGLLDIHANILLVGGFNVLGTPSAILGDSIQIHSDHLQLQDRAGISTAVDRPQAGGNIQIETNDFHMNTGAFVTAASNGEGKSGNIQIAASNQFRMDSAIVNASADLAESGSITIQSPEVSLRNRSLIRSETLGAGNAAPISILGGTVEIDSSIVSNSALQAEGGALTISADKVLLTNGTGIGSISRGPGNAGDILIVASDMIRSQNSQITTEADQAFGGNITIINRRLVHLIDSTVSTSVKAGEGDGGNITIDPPFVMVDNSKIIAQAVGGNGGNIFITAGTFLASPESVISASSQAGVSGQVLIQAPVSNLAGTLSRLSQTPLNAAELLTARCSARLREGTASSLTLAGRDGVPAEPGSFRPTAFVAGAYRPTGAPTIAARPSPTARPPLVLPSPRPEFYALRDASPLPLGCGS